MVKKIIAYILILVSTVCFIPLPNVHGVDAPAQSQSQFTYKEIFPEHFGIKDDVYTGKTGGNYSEANLFDTIFSADIKVSGAETWFIYGATSEWMGLCFRFTKDGITLRHNSENLKYDTYSFVSEHTGTELYGKRFLLQIGMRNVDYEGDQKNDDVELAVYFNGRLYNDSLIYLKGIAGSLGNGLYIHPDVNGSDTATQEGSIYEIATPQVRNATNLLNVTPADFGIVDGEASDMSGSIPGTIDGKCLSLTMKTDTVGDYLDYGGIRLVRDSEKSLLVSAKGDISYLQGTEQVEQLSFSDFNIKNESYPYKTGGDYAVRGTSNVDSLDGTYFSAMITIEDRIDFRYGETGAWAGGLRVFMYAPEHGLGKYLYIMKPDATVLSQISPQDVGLTSFRRNAFKLGISIRYCDGDGDGLDDVEYGIWINDRFCTGYQIWIDGLQKMGTQIGICPPRSASITTVESVKEEARIRKVNITDFSEEFPLDISVNYVDYDMDGNKDDAKIGVWVGDEQFGGPYAYACDYTNALNSTLQITGCVRSTPKKMSYDCVAYSVDGNQNDAWTDLQEKALFSGEVSLTSNESALQLQLQGDRSSKPVVLQCAEEDRLTISGLDSQDILIPGIAIGDTFTYAWLMEPTDLDNDGSTDDLSVVLWLNGSPVQNRTYFFENCIDADGALSVKVFGEDAVMSRWLPEMELKCHSYNLHANGENDDQTYLVAGSGEIMINRNGGYYAGDKLDVPNEYIIVRNELGQDYEQRIALWKTGYVNADKEVDVKDLVAAIKVEAGIETNIAREKGSDLDFNGCVNEADLSKMRAVLIGKEELPEASPYQSYAYEDGVMPIGGYYGPLSSYEYANKDGSIAITEEQLTDDVFKAISDAGINLITHTETSNRDSIVKGLELAEKYGIGMYIMSNTFDLVRTETKYAQLIAKYSRYSSFRGFFLQDEPISDDYWILGDGTSTKKLSAGAERMNRIHQYTNLCGYINLLPIYNTPEDQSTQDTEANYKKYLQEYTGTSEPHMISYDHYIFTWGDESYYFKNLSIVREEALKNKIPFWGFVQAKDDNAEGQISQTQAQTYWNVNTQLAYGAKGIQYFPLVQPYSYTLNGTDYNRSGLIGANGAETEFYDQASNANKWIQKVDEVLMNSISKEILAVKGALVQNSTGISKTSYGVLKSITLSSTNQWFGRGCIVGCFDYQGKEAFYVVNNDYENAQTISLEFDSQHAARVIDATSDENTVIGKTYSVNLQAGAAKLIIIE